MVGAVFEAILPFDLVWFFNWAHWGTLPEQFTAFNKIVLLVWRIQTVGTNQNGIAIWDMLEKSFDEFIYGKRHQLTLFPPIVEGCLMVSDFTDPAVGNRSPPKVATQISQDLIHRLGVVTPQKPQFFRDCKDHMKMIASRDARLLRYNFQSHISGLWATFYAPQHSLY